MNRRQFLGGIGGLMATTALPSFADDPSVFPARGNFERLALGYAHIKAGATAPFSLLHISDTHLTAAYEREGIDKMAVAARRTCTFGGRQEEALRDSLAWAKENVDYVLHTGDLIDWQSEANFDLVKKHYGAIGLGTMGNHEYSPSMWLSDPQEKPTDEFQWATPVEIYFDGDYAPLGTYHFFSYMYNGVLKYTGKGPTPDTDPRPWSVENKSTMFGGKKGMISLMTFPMTTIGIDISKGNKCGFQVVSGGSGWWGCSWNGGQWHSPTGFQTLRFEMK